MADLVFAAALQASVDEVLEKMFFVPSLSEPEGCLEQPAVVAARLTFEGYPSGSLTLHVSACAARSVAADFLGVEDSEPSEQEIGEVVCELANMICGSVLSRVESTATFRLSSPHLVTSNDPPPDDRDHSAPQSILASHSVGICGGAMMIVIDTEQSECLTAQEHES